MKHLKLLLIFLTFLANALSYGQKAPVFFLKGETTSAFEGAKLYIESKFHSDSVIVKNGKFSFNTQNLRPEEYLIHATLKNKKEAAILYYADNYNTTLKISDSVLVVGNSKFFDCKVIGNPTDSIMREINLAIFTNTNDRLFSSPEFKAKLVNAARRHDNASIFAMRKYCVIYCYYAGMLEDVEESMKAMSPTLKQTSAYKELEAEYEQYSKRAVGQLMPDFTMNTPDGKAVSMLDYVKGKKLVLIDFWASWCKPCRAEYKNVRKLYQDYHSKGFDVFSVSLDSKMEDWTKAIATDSLTWMHVSDLKGWATTIKNVYKFTGIPQLYLVDGEGRLVARDIRGQELADKVAEVLDGKNTFASAQGLSRVIPLDEKVKTGVLPNGFTYYIRHNEEPKNRVTIYLATKAGSINEKENQRGLAHFMEHMSFNGTKHFPKNALVNYLQKQGVKFGGDLNAYTTFDETVYQLPIPTDNPDLLHNGFQIMRDWAHEATLDIEEIDKERGVILEEKRLHENSQERMRRQYFPMLTNNSLYAERVPIGTEEVLKTFKRADILDFYNSWYRPNLQALIVVGDIDVDATEKTIKSMFSDLKNPDSCPERKDYSIALTGKNQFKLVTDKEMTVPTMQVFVKFKKENLKTAADYKQSLCKNIFNAVLRERFSDLAKKSDSPFLDASANTSGLLGNLEVFTVSMSAQPEKFETAFRTVWTEIERIKKAGISTYELNRAKSIILSSMENSYNERNTTASASYVSEYLRHFLEGEASPGIAYELNLSKKLLPGITAKDVMTNAMKYMTDVNRDILIMATDKDANTLPTEADINKCIADIKAMKFASANDSLTMKKLFTAKPMKGKVLKQSTDAKTGTTELILSNGIKVVLKPTEFKSDEIKFTAFSPGGTSLYSDKEYESASNAVPVTISGGLGNFSISELDKYMTGKHVSVNPFVNERFEGINGGSNTANLETAFQLIYLYFTQPRKDFSIIKTELDRAKVTMGDRAKDPEKVFADSLAAILSNYNVRRTAPSVEKINNINLERAFEIYKERFADAGDFTFTFVGNINMDTFKPLLETYLASLPSIKRKELAVDLGIQIPGGVITKKVFKGLENKATVRLYFSGNYKYCVDNNNKLYALADLLTIKLIERLREDEGGVYGVNASAKYSKVPHNRFSIQVSFGCAPANVDKLIASTKDVIEKLKTQLPEQSDLDKVNSEDKRAMEVQLKTNNFWLAYLNNQLQNNEPFSNILSFDENLKKITPVAVQNAAKQYLTGKNYLQVVLYPEK